MEGTLSSKKSTMILAILAFVSVMALWSAVDPSPVLASKITDAKTNAGISTTSSDKDAVSDFKPVAYFLMGIAGIFAVIMAVWGGMKLSAGSANAKLRTEGIIGIICAGAGGWVAYKAFDIVGHFINI